jgi:hypothetical protein
MHLTAQSQSSHAASPQLCSPLLLAVWEYEPNAGIAPHCVFQLDEPPLWPCLRARFVDVASLILGQSTPTHCATT